MNSSNNSDNERLEIKATHLANKTTIGILLVLLILLIAETTWTVLVREAITPIPPGDGPIQTMNWLTRLEGGEIAGRDFQIFHGIGVILAHFPAHLIFGGGVQGALLSFFTTSALFVITLFAFAAYPKRSGKTEALLALVISLSTYLLLSCSPWLIAKIVLPGHSMIACRAALGLIAILVFHKLASLDWLKQAIAGGAIAGASCFFSLDQGVAVLAGISAFLCIAACQRQLGFKKLLIQGIGLLSSSAVSLVLITSIASLGSPLAQLEYSFISLPGDQMWFFGGPPNPYVQNIFSIFIEPPFLLAIALWCVILCLLLRDSQWNLERFRKQSQLPLLMGLLTTGLFAYLSKLGMNSGHYQTSLFLGAFVALITLLKSGSILKLLKQHPKAALCAAVLFMGACGAVTYKRASSQRTNDSSAGRDFAHLQSLTEDGNSKVWSTYRGISEQKLGLPRLTPWDYIIHALGKKNEKDYVETFLETNPDVVRTIKPDGFSDAPANSQWLWHTRYAFFGELVRGWQPKHIGETYVDWERRQSKPRYETAKYDILVSPTPKGFEWKVTGTKLPTHGQTLIFTLSFEESNSVGATLGGKKFARRVIKPRAGVLDGDSFAVPHSQLGYGPFKWALIADGRDWPSGSFEINGPLETPEIIDLSFQITSGQVLDNRTLQALIKRTEKTAQK